MIKDIIRLGMNHNVGERHLGNQLILSEGQGKKIK
jgi:hypothetical protein